MRWAGWVVAWLATGVPDAVQQPPRGPVREDWIQLFNGENLDGTDVKLTGHGLGDNFGDTFRGQ